MIIEFAFGVCVGAHREHVRGYLFGRNELTTEAAQLGALVTARLVQGSSTDIHPTVTFRGHHVVAFGVQVFCQLNETPVPSTLLAQTIHHHQRKDVLHGIFHRGRSLRDLFAEWTCHRSSAQRPETLLT